MDSARKIVATVRHGFAPTRLDPDAYRHLITDDLSPDEGDRAHAAACIGGHVDVLVTRNISDFRSDRLAAAGVRVMTGDDYLTELLRRRPRAILEAFIGLAGMKARPPMTPCELAEQLHRAGAPRFAARLGHRFSCV